MNFFKIQKTLMVQHPDLKEKRLILQYYMSFDYPQKQKKLINWWEMMIQSAVKASDQIFLSPADLQQIFTLHGLKPVPLQSVLNILQFKEKIQWRNRDNIIDRGHNQNLSLIKKIIGVFLPQKSNKQKLSRYISLQNENKSKIISKNLLSQKIGTLKQIILQQLNNQKYYSYDQMTLKIKQKSNLSKNAIMFIIDQLQIKGWIKIQNAGGQKLIVYSDTLFEYSNKNWVQVQKHKFILNYQISEFQKKIETKQKQKARLKQLAKKVVQVDKPKARQYIIQIKKIDQLISNIELRLQAIRNSLHNFQTNEFNNKITQIISQSNKALKQSALDPEVLDSLREDNIQIKSRQKQITSRLQQLQNDSDQEEMVLELMNQLQAEIKSEQKNKKKEIITKKQRSYRQQMYQL